MNRIRGGPLILCLVTLLVTALSVTMSLTTAQDNSTPSTAAYAAIFVDPLDAAATQEVVVLGDAKNSENKFAEIIWSAGSAPPLDVGSSTYALNPTTSTGTTDANACAMSKGSDSEARGMVTISKEDGTHRFTAART